MNSDFMTISTQWGWWAVWGIYMSIAFAVLVSYIVYKIRQSKVRGVRLDDALEFKDIVAISAALYFLYQIPAGAFFASTSIIIEGTRLDPETVLVRAVIERGDQWLVQISNADYEVKSANKSGEWRSIDFRGRILTGKDDHRGGNGLLRLAPKEKTQASFVVKAKENETITARVTCFPILWPVTSESYASIIVPLEKTSTKRK